MTQWVKNEGNIVCVCVYVCLFVSARVKSVSSTRKNLQQRSLINLLKVEGRSFVPLTNHPSSQPSVRSSIHSTVIHPFNCRPSYSIVSHPLNCQPPIHPADRQSAIYPNFCHPFIQVYIKQSVFQWSILYPSVLLSIIPPCIQLLVGQMIIFSQVRFIPLSSTIQSSIHHPSVVYLKNISSLTLSVCPSQRNIYSSSAPPKLGPSTLDA